MLRLQRRGKLHQPSYRLVVGEKRSELLGEQVEDLGWYNPAADSCGFNKERVHYWLKVGAKMSPTVNNLLVGAKIVEGKKAPVHKKKKVDVTTKPAA